METSEYQPLEYHNGVYAFGRVDLLEMLRRDPKDLDRKTPCYIYDLGIIEKQARRLLDAIAWHRTKLLLAVKQLPNLEVIKIVHSMGYGIDAVSIGEIKRSLTCGVSKDEILYTANNMSGDEDTVFENEMEIAMDLGVHLNIDSCERFEEYGKAYPGTKVFVRINPKIVADTHKHWQTSGPNSKFGTPPKHIKKILAIAQKYRLKIVGIHEHIGTSILKPEQLLLAMRALLKEAKYFPDLEILDFGGGVGVPYKPGDQEIDIEKFGKQATKLFARFCKKYGRELIFMMEPGRYICAEAGILLATVTTVKRNPDGRIYVGVNTGFNHLGRPMIYGSYHPMVNISNPDGPLETCDIAGNICESGDIFARDRSINAARRGDVIAILKTGASGTAMEMTYNDRLRTSEIVIRDGRSAISRPRERYEDFMKRYIMNPTYI